MVFFVLLATLCTDFELASPRLIVFLVFDSLFLFHTPEIALNISYRHNLETHTHLVRMLVIFFPWPGKPNYFFVYFLTLFGFGPVGIERARIKLPHGRWSFYYLVSFSLNIFFVRGRGWGGGGGGMA